MAMSEAEKVASAIDRVLTRTAVFKKQSAEVPPSAFHNCDVLTHKLSVGNEDSLYDPTATLADVDGVLDASFVSSLTDSSEGVYLWRIRTVSTRVARGRISPRHAIFGGRIVEFSHGLFPHQSVFTSGRIYASVKGTRMLVVDTSRPGMLGKDVEAQFPDGETRFRLGAAVTQQFDRPMQWRAIVGRPKGVSIGVPTDPTGIRELFRKRESAGGRRAPLVHWVADHYRKSRKDDEDARIFVRQHLRGKTRFEWGKYVVQVAIPTDETVLRQDMTVVERARDELSKDRAEVAGTEPQDG
jgi:hypothetical protein